MSTLTFSHYVHITEVSNCFIHIRYPEAKIDKSWETKFMSNEILSKYVPQWDKSCTPLMYQIQSTLVVSTSVISNNSLSRRENLVLL